jgi:UDP-3-O-[3-hydroxymyristoyl] glucosamine N-acyltransferase
MASNRFFSSHPATSLAHLAELVDGQLVNMAAGQVMIEGVTTLDKATGHMLAVLNNVQQYASHMETTKAAAVLLESAHVGKLPAHVTGIVVKEPYLALAKVLQFFYGTPESLSNTSIHPTAVVAPTAKIGQGCQIAAYAVIGDNATMGEGTSIGAHSYIGYGVNLGSWCRVGPHVTIECAEIGSHVTIDAGARIGQAGFGFHRDYVKGHVPVLQVGRVIIEDRVLIGANTTIDRGSLEDTVIGQGTMIDNLVQIAHNVKTGRNCVIVAQVGVAGSTQMGNAVTLAGQAGIAGHVTLGDGCVVAGQSGVMRDVAPGEAVGGSPSVPIKQWHRQSIALQKLTMKKGGQDDC